MASYFGDSNMNGLLAAMMQPVRRKIFVTYHHGNDQAYYDEFSRFFHDQYEAVFDNSLERSIDSDNVQYVMQRIRDNHIMGTSCTVLLIGAQTHQRKYVDWEIKATLAKQHGLLGIVLPTHQTTYDGKIVVPDRFHDNVLSGYAQWVHANGLTAQHLTTLINAAAATPKILINNSRDMRRQNG